MAASMLCKIRRSKYGETCSSSGTRKTKHACIVEADDSARKRLEGTLHKDHEDNIAGKGINSLATLQSCAWVYSYASSNEKTGCESCSAKWMEKIEKIPSSSWRKSVTKKRWSMKQRKKAQQYMLLPLWIFVIEKLGDGATISKVSRSSCTLRWHCDRWCRLLRSITEQGLSASQMTVAQVLDVIAGLPGCAGQAADAVSAYIQVKMEDAPTSLKIPKSECPDIWIRLPRHKWAKSSSMEDPVVPLERNLYGHLLAGPLWERQLERAVGTCTVGKKFQSRNAYL